MLRPRKNRRRVDAAKKTAELKAVATSHGPWVLKLLGAITALVLLGVGGHEGWIWAKRAPQFAITTITWSGNARATQSELTRLSGLPDFSRVATQTTGQNLLALDVAATERSLAQHPWVKRVDVSRKLPNKLTVRVEEHTAVAMVNLGELYLLAADGTPFKKVQIADALDLPLVSGVDRDAYVANPASAKAQLQASLVAIAAFNESTAAKGLKLSEVVIDDEGVTLFADNGLELRLGEGALDDKLARFGRVRQELKARQLTAQVIRLDNRARPAWVSVQLQERSAPAVSPERGGPTGK